MNKSNLQSLFKRYIDNFEKINAKETNETYKWEIAEEFQSFNIEAKDFADELNKYWKISNNLFIVYIVYKLIFISLILDIDSF